MDGKSKKGMKEYNCYAPPQIRSHVRMRQLKMSKIWMKVGKSKNGWKSKNPLNCRMEQIPHVESIRRNKIKDFFKKSQKISKILKNSRNQKSKNPQAQKSWKKPKNPEDPQTQDTKKWKFPNSQSSTCEKKNLTNLKSPNPMRLCPEYPTPRAQWYWFVPPPLTGQPDTNWNKSLPLGV